MCLFVGCVVTQKKFDCPDNVWSHTNLTAGPCSHISDFNDCLSPKYSNLRQKLCKRDEGNVLTRSGEAKGNVWFHVIL